MGAVQGITEFLPISSSGHLILVPWAAGWDSPLLTGLTFQVAVHFGTGVAAFATLLHQWRELLVDARRATGNARPRLTAIVVGTAGVGIIAILAESSVETVFREPWIVALALILGGALLWAADRAAGPADTSPTTGFLPWLVIALSQVVAFIPGISRSGITMTTARFLGIARVPAAIFSFQLMAPIILGAALWRGRDLVGGATSGSDLAVLAVGALTSAVTGFLAARLLLAFLARNGFGPFALYRGILGLAALAFFLTRL